MGSTTVIAKNDELKELLNFTAIPFDDRIHHKSSLEELKLLLVYTSISLYCLLEK